MRSAYKYLASGRERKLYRQWVEMAELPPENIAQEEVREVLVQERVRAEMPGSPISASSLKKLYTIQIVGLVMTGVVLVLLILQSC